MDYKGHYAESELREEIRAEPLVYQVAGPDFVVIKMGFLDTDDFCFKAKPILSGFMAVVAVERRQKDQLVKWPEQCSLA